MKKILHINQPHDFTESNLRTLQEFIDAGLPDISSLNEEKQKSALSLYLIGKTYSEISRILSVPKEQILYLGHNNGWYQIKQESLHELRERLPARLEEAKLHSKEFLVNLEQFILRTLSKQIETASSYRELDCRLLDRLLKVLDHLEKFSADSGGKSAPPSTAMEQRPESFAKKTLRELAAAKRKEQAMTLKKESKG